MMSRIVTTMALVAGTALLCLPVQAQTGTTARDAVNSGGASPTGSVGTTSNTPRDNSSSTSTTMGSMGGGTTNSPGMTGSQGTMGTGMTQPSRYQAQAHRSGRMQGGNAAEQQMTACLNNAASQNQPLDSCRR